MDENTLRAAEVSAGVSLTDEERALLLPGMQQFLTHYDRLRATADAIARLMSRIRDVWCVQLAWTRRGIVCQARQLHTVINYNRLPGDCGLVGRQGNLLRFPGVGVV